MPILNSACNWSSVSPLKQEEEGEEEEEEEAVFTGDNPHTLIAGSARVGMHCIN